MILYPAIDLKDGACVRLMKGDMDQATQYNDNPAAQAHDFARAGFSWLHIVDLNGAFEGVPVNAAPVRAIVDAVDIPVQLGGGIRTLEQVEYWIEEGISRVILGTAAVKDPTLVQQACDRFPGQIAVSLDARGDHVALSGWAEQSGQSIYDLATRFEAAGIAALIYTDIERDGTGEGLNIMTTRALAEHVNIPIIASGGVGSMEDLMAVKAAAPIGISGVIVGRALYDGRITPEEALKVAADEAVPM